jgi:cytosine deaminase
MSAYRWPPAWPPAGRSLLRNATIPSCLVDAAPAGATPDREGLLRVDLALEDGRIADVQASGAPANAADTTVELDGNQVWPCFVDMHTHLDKGHIWPRSENHDGSFAGAIAANTADRDARWTAGDVAARMRFALATAHAHGTVAIRTHLDSAPPQHLVSWPVFARMRDEWRGRIELQAAAIVALDRLLTPFGEELADCVAAHGGVFGGMPVPGPDVAAQIERAFVLAEERGLDLDFHADESGDAGARSLAVIAETALRRRFAGRVVVGHCCSLAVQADDDVDRTLDLVAKAGLAVVSLPMCNLFLQDRAPARTPRWRGVTLLHEMRARGIPVAVASDNCRDPYYAYGDQDMLEVFAQAARIAHLDRPVDPWPAAAVRTPADVLGLPAYGRIRAGAVADLCLFNARGYSELLSRPQADRVVLRAGRPVDTRPPDYRELDALAGMGGT